MQHLFLFQGLFSKQLQFSKSIESKFWDYIYTLTTVIKFPTDFEKKKKKIKTKFFLKKEYIYIIMTG